MFARSFSAPCFPYTVFVAVLDDEVVIVAVAHQRREPGYWAERVKQVER